MWLRLQNLLEEIQLVFTILRGSAEFLEKQPTHTVSVTAGTDVKGAKVGFTAFKKMKLITEEVTNVKVLTEGKGPNKKLYIEGVFLQGRDQEP